MKCDLQENELLVKRIVNVHVNRWCTLEQINNNEQTFMDEHDSEKLYEDKINFQW
jgi:hypothetical protein